MADLRDGRTGRVRVVSFASAGDSLMPVGCRRAPQDVRGCRSPRPSARPTRRTTAFVRVGWMWLWFSSHTARGRNPRTGCAHAPARRPRPVPRHAPLEPSALEGEVVDLQDLAGDDWIAAVGVNGLGRDETVAMTAAAGFSPRFAALTVEFPAAQAYVALGIGVGLVPALAQTVHEGVVDGRSNQPEPRHVWALTRPRSSTMCPSPRRSGPCGRRPPPSGATPRRSRRPAVDM